MNEQEQIKYTLQAALRHHVKAAAVALSAFERTEPACNLCHRPIELRADTTAGIRELLGGISLTEHRDGQDVTFHVGSNCDSPMLLCFACVSKLKLALELPSLTRSTHFTRYVKLRKKLKKLIEQDRDDSDEADALRDEMDKPWHQMTAEERAALHGTT